VAYVNGAVAIAPGATVTCTFTNSKKPRLTVIKKIVGGNGTTDAYDVKVDGATKIDDAASTAPAGTSSGAFAVSAGQHTVTETLGNGSPVGGDWVVGFSGDCDASGLVDVQNDQSKTCTVTNSKLPRLRVVKEIEGGDGSAFDISVGGTKVLDDAGDGAADERTYAPGGYDVSETLGDGAAIGSDWTVVYSGDCDAAGHVSLAYGDAKTCTITNKRKPKLTVVKVIEGGNGAAFDLKVNGSIVLDDVAGDGGQVTNTYPVDTAYSVSETLGNGDAVDPSVWETSLSADCAGTLHAGDDKTCTVTNKRKPKLTVVKVIQGGNGASFDLKVNDDVVLDDVDASGGQVTSTYPVGTAYSVSETLGNGDAVDPAVWETSLSADCAGTLAAGEHKTCTVTNKRKPKLTVVKVIEGGNGAAFDLEVNDDVVLDDVDGTGGQVTNTYPVDTAYSVTESLGNGDAVDPSVWESSLSADCSGTLHAGDDKTCTVTNKRKPKLTVVKVIEGGNGASFDLKVNDDVVLDDVEGTGGQVTNTYPVDTAYPLSETLGNGDAVDPSVWETTLSDDCAGVLHAGEHKTCTITNKRKPKLTVVKVIEGGNGASFDLKVNDEVVLDDVAGTGGQVTNTYPVDTAYSVSETLGNGDSVDPSVWETSLSDDCSGTLHAGEHKTCTVTNKRKPVLTVVKHIIGGDGSVFDISVGQVKALDDAGDGASDTRTYAPGTYPVTETLGNGAAVPAGWSTSFSSDCAEGSVTLAYGDAKTCTVTNSKLPQLIVIKQVVSGAKSPSDFQISVAGNSPSPASFPGDSQGTIVTLQPGGYDVSEGEDVHYSASYSADCKDGTIAYGETKTCTITNTRKPSGITIDKVASPTSVPEPGADVTFTFRVHNTSAADTVTIDALTDSVFGNLFLRGDCGALENAELAPDDGAAGGADEATCAFTAHVSGNAGDSHHNVGTVTGHDEDQRTVTDNDDADVEITDVAPSIDVTKTADPTSVPEPGGPVQFTVDVKNTSVSTDPVTITSLVDDPDGAGPAEPIDLNGKGTCSVPQTIQPGETYTCKFTRSITGNAGDVKIDVVTASGHDDDQHEVSDHDDATVTITDVPSSISVDKSANPTSVQEPGGNVAFTVVVRNTSAVDAVTIDTVVDSIYGDLAAKGTCGALIGKVLQPDDHAAGGPDQAACTFTGAVTGSAGSVHTNVVTVTGHDDDEHPLTAHDDATVTITPAPVVHNPLIDLYVTKNDLPDPVQVNGLLTYTIVVGNNGPDAATQVTLADPLPAGTVFVSVTTTQGTCTGGALVSCNLGTVPTGSTVTITLVVRATQPGLLTNTATVIGKEPESNAANNQATATTLVPAPLVRKAKKVLVCDRFTVAPGTLRVGKRATVVVHVTASGKPVKGRKVVVRGAGIVKAGRTNARGVARIVVTARRPGIVTVTVPQKLTCGGKRIAVLGAITAPRFTG
jgi:uncharacterized repeat protein (TIGR01451 family)